MRIEMSNPWSNITIANRCKVRRSRRRHAGVIRVIVTWVRSRGQISSNISNYSKTEWLLRTRRFAFFARFLRRFRLREEILRGSGLSLGVRFETSGRETGIISTPPFDRGDSENSEGSGFLCGIGTIVAPFVTVASAFTSEIVRNLSSSSVSQKYTKECVGWVVYMNPG